MYALDLLTVQETCRAKKHSEIAVCKMTDPEIPRAKAEQREEVDSGASTAMQTVLEGTTRYGHGLGREQSSSSQGNPTYRVS